MSVGERDTVQGAIRAMLGIILTAVGWVGSSTGLMLWATAEVMIDEHDLMYDSGLILMIGGAIVGIAGMALYRSAEAKVERALATRPDNS